VATGSVAPLVVRNGARHRLPTNGVTRGQRRDFMSALWQGLAVEALLQDRQREFRFSVHDCGLRMIYMMPRDVR
jgi:hypothetical protein